MHASTPSSSSLPCAEPVAISAADILRMQEHAGAAARMLKSLAHPTRLLILCHVWEGELAVGELNARVPVSQSVLSQHLSVLRDEGLVGTRREAQRIFYHVADARAGRVLALLHDLYCPRPDSRDS